MGVWPHTILIASLPCVRLQVRARGGVRIDPLSRDLIRAPFICTGLMYWPSIPIGVCSPALYPNIASFRPLFCFIRYARSATVPAVAAHMPLHEAVAVPRFSEQPYLMEGAVSLHLIEGASLTSPFMSVIRIPGSNAVRTGGVAWYHTYMQHCNTVFAMEVATKLKVFNIIVLLISKRDAITLPHNIILILFYCNCHAIPLPPTALPFCDSKFQFYCNGHCCCHLLSHLLADSMAHTHSRQGPHQCGFTLVLGASSSQSLSSKSQPPCSLYTNVYTYTEYIYHDVYIHQCTYTHTTIFIRIYIYIYICIYTMQSVWRRV